MKNNKVLEMTKGMTKRFSWVYKPGAMKAQTWYKTTGKANKNAAINKILSGTMKGEITDVAMRVVPAGKCETKGAANKS
jgi:hypothetical protein